MKNRSTLLPLAIGGPLEQSIRRVLTVTLLVMMVIGDGGATQPARTAADDGSGAEARLGADTSLPYSIDPDAATKQRVIDEYGRLSLSFEKNEGQTDSRVSFTSRGRGYALFLLDGGEAVLALKDSATSTAARERKSAASRIETRQRAANLPRMLPLDHKRGVRSGAVLRMKPVGANAKVRAQGREQLLGKVNYLLGNDAQRWRTGIATFNKVRYENVYPGIDLVYYGNQRKLEYDFIVGPGADPRHIALRFDGADKVELDRAGGLVVRTRVGDVYQAKPQIYQEINGRRHAISGGYTLRGRSVVGFEVGAYDVSQTLIIDPTLAYSTYVGDSNDDAAFEVAVDGTGSAYVTGQTNSGNFPTTPGAFDTTFNGTYDVFVTKLNPAGSALVYSTYLGGSDHETGHGIAVDGTGSAYVTGQTRSGDFPITLAAFDTTFNGIGDVFVTKLIPTGSAVAYSTYLGGDSVDIGSGVAVDGAGNAYVTGLTLSADFPTTPGAFDETFNGASDVFVTKLIPAGSALVYSTYLGGSDDDAGIDVAVDDTGSAYATGRTHSGSFPTTLGAFDTTFNGLHGGHIDAFVTKLDPSGSTLNYSTYLGGSDNDIGVGVAVDGTNSAYVAGFTRSGNFPTTPGAFDATFNGGFNDAFVTKLNPPGSALDYSTYLGGSDTDAGLGVAVDGMGSAYVTGFTSSANFPTTPGTLDTTYNGVADVFVTKLNPAGSAPLVYSTYLGGGNYDEGQGVVVDATGSAYVTGYTQSGDLPTTPGAFDTTFNGSNDAFVAKITTLGAPATLTLTPPAASNPVETQHCVTAVVADAAGNPVPNITVRFTVTGSVNTSGSGTTDQNGEVTFCYIGPSLPGTDAISAYADTDNDNTQDPGEPTGAATKSWTFPETTPLCEIRITNGGWTIAANGDRASFGGSAQSDESGATKGEEQFQDHGPAQPLNAHSINVQAIVCEGSMQASIYGQATINGSGTFTYRIRVKDLSEPGVGHDSYWLLLQTGYNSGQQVLRGGNVQIRRE